MPRGGCEARQGRLSGDKIVRARRRVHRLRGGQREGLQFSDRRGERLLARRVHNDECARRVTDHKLGAGLVLERADVRSAAANERAQLRGVHVHNV